MGNVQSESSQESETTKDGVEKANLDRSKPSWGPSSTKRESRSSQTIDPKNAGQPQAKEAGGTVRQTGAVEMGKSSSKKSKLKLSSMWTQNLSSGGINETSLCAKDPVMERRGLACLGRADLQNSQGAGSILPGDQKGLKAALKAPHDHRDLGTRKEAAKAKSKAENASPGLLLQPERLMEQGPSIAVKEVVAVAAETKVCGTQPIKASPKESSEPERRPPNSAPPPCKLPESLTLSPAPLNTNEEAAGAPKFLGKKNVNRPLPSCGVVPPGGKEVLPSWGSGEKEREKQPTGQPDSAPGSDGDSKGAATASQLVAEHATASSSPMEKHPASGSDAKAGEKNEVAGAEDVTSETMQELLERGLNFLYKVTIQPGQWTPSVKAVKQKAGPVPPGVSYADILKQCPQKKGPGSAPALLKTLHHLTTSGKKLPSFKGLEKTNPEEYSSLRHMFLEHFKKVTQKEPASQAPSQQVVTFLEETTTANPKRPEWHRPRPPTPYPQHRKGRSRKLPMFDAAVPQVVTFLGSDAKCDSLAHDESQMLSDEAAVMTEEAGSDPLEQASAGDQEAEEASFPPSVTAFFFDQDIAEEADKSGLRSWWEPPGPEDGAKEAVLLKALPCILSQGILSPLGTVQSSQAEEQCQCQSPMPVPTSQFLSDTPEVPGPTASAPCSPTQPAPEQKAPAAVQVRPKVRKQGSAAPKSKEKLRSSGQPKAKAPKGKGQKQRSRGGGVTSPLRLEQVPLFTPFEKVTRPFYFGEPSEVPLSQDKPAATKEDTAPNQDAPEENPEVPRPAECCRWPAFQVVDSCSRKCYCKHQEERKLPKNVVAWLNPTTNHLAEPPWVATALLAVSLVAGTKFCLDSYKQQHFAHED